MASAPTLKLPNTFANSPLHKRVRSLDLVLVIPSEVAAPPSTVRRKAPSVVAAVSGVSVNGVAHTRVNGHHSHQPSGGSGLRVSFQGAPGAYSEFAANMASPDCTTVPCRSFSDAIAAVERGRADRAILPVESTMEGSALRNYDLLLRHDLRIVQEVNLFVHYCLLAMPGVRQAELRRVISHPMALAHCGRALAQLGIHDREPVEDTAGAVEMLRSERLLDTAAIASPRAALIYGLDVLAHGLQDESWNVTRFLLVAPRQSSASPDVPLTSRQDAVKTSMAVAHRGSSMVVLLKVLSAFSKRNINLTKMEVINSSMENNKAPVMILDTRGKGLLRAFPHVLYVDCEGSAEDPLVKEAIDEITEFSVFIRILGCYAADPNIYDLQ